MLVSAISPAPLAVPAGARALSEPGLHGWWWRGAEAAGPRDAAADGPRNAEAAAPRGGETGPLQTKAYAPRGVGDTCRIDGPLAEQPPQLAVFDVDSTLIAAEQIDLLAEQAGAGARVAAITERAMRGELDFAASLAERVATLAGLPAGALDEVRAGIPLSPGAEALIAALHRHGCHVGLVSGGFAEIVAPLADHLGIELIAANRLAVAGGRLTGATQGPIVDRATKARLLRSRTQALGASPDRTVAIGDGANDLDMLAAAGLGIAYCAKPAVAAAADATISFPRLDAAAIVLGIA